MIDDRTSTHPAAPNEAEHWCEHPGCTKWGGFGYARSKAERPVWHCSEHYLHKPFNKD